MKIIILSGNQLRHKYFVNEIAKQFEITALFCETKAYNPATDIFNGIKEEKELWEWHFGLARDEEEKFFGGNNNFTINSSKINFVPKGEINKPTYVNKIKSYNPDVIVVYGTSLLKNEIISICPGKIFNLHLGLSPYYRGSGTNFWALHNNEPEYVGVTIHIIDPGIDTGPIIHQGRPNIELGDNQHSIGNKTVIIGTRLMIQALKEAEAGTLKAFPQTEKGKLYQRKDFSVKNISELKELMDKGMISQYLKRQSEACEEAKIIS